MAPKLAETEGSGEVLRVHRHTLQFWSIMALGLLAVGIAFTIYDLLRSASLPASLQGLNQWVGPLLFGLISLLVLVNLYATEKDAIMAGLRHELIQQKIEAELNRELALVDPVTEVYNRRYLRAILAKEVSRMKRYGEHLTVMMVDITGFRRVNESLGHTGGDVVLRQIAHLIQTRIRNSDTIVRFGGDEFLLVLPDSEESGVHKLAGRMKDALREWTRHSGMTDFKLRFAVGSASFAPDASVEEVLGLAERRMKQDRLAPEEEEQGRSAPAGVRKTTS